MCQINGINFLLPDENMKIFIHETSRLILNTLVRKVFCELFICIIWQITSYICTYSFGFVSATVVFYFICLFFSTAFAELFTLRH